MSSQDKLPSCPRVESGDDAREFLLTKWGLVIERVLQTWITVPIDKIRKFLLKSMEEVMPAQHASQDPSISQQ